MYNTAQILSTFEGLVAWRQNIDPSGLQLNDMLVSESGLFFNDVHPLLTIDNLISVAPQFDMITYPVWVATTTYTVGQVAESGGTNYKCIQAGTGNLVSDTDYWIEHSPFTEWLKERTNAGIIQAINAWKNRKFKSMTARNLLDRNKLYTATGSINDIQVKENKIVGIEVIPTNSPGLIFTIQKIGFQADTNGSIDLHLFDNETLTPTKIITVSYVGNGSVQWLDVNWQLKGGNTYWVAYNENDLAGSAINSVKDYSAKNDGKITEQFSEYFDATVFSNDETDISNLWDITENHYTFATNYGINMMFDVRCDYTDLIVEQKDLFKDVIALQVGISLLMELATNPNSNINRNEANVGHDTIMFYLYGDTQSTEENKTGLVKQLNDSIYAVLFDTENIDPICLPCSKRGVRYTST